MKIKPLRRIGLICSLESLHCAMYLSRALYLECSTLIGSSQEKIKPSRRIGLIHSLESVC